MALGAQYVGYCSNEGRISIRRIHSFLIEDGRVTSLFIPYPNSAYAGAVNLPQWP